MKTADLDALRKDLEKEFNIAIPAAEFKMFRFVGSVIAHVERVLKSPAPARPPAPSPVPPGGYSGGIRPG